MPGTSPNIIAKYTKYNGRRKTESLAPDTYSLVNYQEAENVVADFKTSHRQSGENFQPVARSQTGCVLRIGTVSHQGQRAGK